MSFIIIICYLYNLLKPDFIAGSAATSMSSAASVQSIWSVVNQYQLMMTFQLVGWYISPEVQDYINEFQFSSFSFSFIPYFNVPYIDKAYNFFWTTQTYSDLKNVGLDWGSTIANEFSLFVNLFWVILLNIAFLMIRKCLIHKAKKEWIIKIFNVVSKTFLLAIYIRLVIEAYLYFLMSGVSEVKAFQTHGLANIISLALTIPMLLWTIFFSGFIGYHFYKHRKSNSNDFSRLLEEIYANVKETTIGKFYTTMFLLRRIFIVLIIMSGSYTPVLFRAISFAVVQICAAIYVILRPFESTKDNIIEIINDVLIALFTITFTVFYQESWWTDTLSSIIVYTLISNGFLINFIIIIDTVFLIIKVN